MTIETPIWMQGIAGVPAYPARNDRTIIEQQWDEGVMDMTAYQVTQRAAGANFTVDVSIGVAVVSGDDQANQGAYLVRCTAFENQTVTAAPGSNSRYDIVCLKINDPNAGGPAGSTATIVVTAGTVAASPVVPTVPASSLLLATIGPITSGTASITNAIIADSRIVAGRRDAPGTMVLSASNRIPSGWLLCNGAAISRTTFARLFAEIGTTHGVGNGSTTFNIPDLRDRVPVAAGTTFSTIGATGGEVTHALTTAELPSHLHTVNPPNTTVAITDPTHAHTNVNTAQTMVVVGGGLTTTGSGGVAINGIAMGNTNAASTGITAAVDIAQFDSGNTGSGTAHNVMQPYQVVGGWRIRT